MTGSSTPILRKRIMRYRVREFTQLFSFVFCALALTVLSGCRSTKSAEEQLADTDLTKDPPKQTLFLTGTKPIEQVTNTNALQFTIERVESNDYPKEIRLFARVFDSTGNFITNLAPPVRGSQEYWKKLTETVAVNQKRRKRTIDIKDFTVREYGASDSIPYAINLLIDYSGSMNGVMDILHDGAEMFIGLKQRQDQIAITSFNKAFAVKVPFAADKSYLTDRFRRVKQNDFGSYSAMYDALLKSIRMFDSLPQEMPRNIIMFSDGDDNFSTTKAREVYLAAKEHNVHIFSVGFGYTHDDVLQFIAEQTGGKYYQVFTKQALRNVFLEIYQSLRNYYLVTYKPPVFAGEHKIELDLQINASDTLKAYGAYSTADIDITSNPSDSFKKLITFEYNKSTLRPESESII
ncbi:MAG: VWA domain-containing protein, partial [Candidatus Kapabacteria bacterium]|nr:VWA domain-containing protein [Candidatus Kapabacteria bacterium]